MSSTGQTASIGGGAYRIEMLSGGNWLPWKRRMMAILRDSGLDKYVEATASRPEVTETDATLKAAEEAARDAWDAGDAKARTRIELAVGDSEMVHLTGAKTARQMWDQLSQVKEARGRLGVLAARRALYRTIAEEGFDMVEHISKLRTLQQELHIMSSVVSDEDFTMILVSSLPESWDLFTSAYLGTKTGNQAAITSGELISILIEEDRRRNTRGGTTAVTFQSHAQCSGHDSSRCNRCGGKGHWARDCPTPATGMPRSPNWGAKPAYTPREPTQRASRPTTADSESESDRESGSANRKRKGHAYRAEKANTFLPDTAYTVRALIAQPLAPHDWVADSGATAHICNDLGAFVKYQPLQNATVSGLGAPVDVTGRGTVLLDFDVDGTTVRHTLGDVLYVPSAPNSLLSLSRFDSAGRRVVFSGGSCSLYSSTGALMGRAHQVGRLYRVAGRVSAPSVSPATATAATAHSWDEWRSRHGHLSFAGLCTLAMNETVEPSPPIALTRPEEVVITQPQTLRAEGESGSIPGAQSQALVMQTKHENAPLLPSPLMKQTASPLAPVQGTDTYPNPPPQYPSPTVWVSKARRGRVDRKYKFLDAPALRNPAGRGAPVHTVAQTSALAAELSATPKINPDAKARIAIANRGDAEAGGEIIPQTVGNALSLAKAENATGDEPRLLDTITLSDELPPGQHAIDDEWILVRKRRNNRRAAMYKSRPVAQKASRNSRFGYSEIVTPLVQSGTLGSIPALGNMADVLTIGLPKSPLYVARLGIGETSVRGGVL